MEISQVITGMLLFAMAMFISDLYNEVKKLKSRVFGDRAYKPDPITRPYSFAALEAKDEEIKSLKNSLGKQALSMVKDAGEIENLKAELNKCKFDYACEVAGKNSMPKYDSPPAPPRQEPKTTKEGEAPEFVNFQGECPTCLGEGKYRRPFTKRQEKCEDCNGTGYKHFER